jgi:hypothetical protein
MVTASRRTTGAAALALVLGLAATFRLPRESARAEAGDVASGSASTGASDRRA